MKLGKRDFLVMITMAFAGTHPACAASRYLLTPRKNTLTDHLEIRDSYTHPVTRISKDQGEREISNLVNSPHTTKEENWMHQGMTLSDHSVWSDISVEQQLCTSRIDYDFLKRIIKGSDRIVKYSGNKLVYTWYHMHPITTLKERFKEAIIKVKDNTEAEIDVEMDIPREWIIEPEKIELLAMPSTGDILVHIEIEKFLKKYGFELEPTKLVMPTGTYTFRPGFKIRELHNKKQREMVEHIRDAAFCAGLGLCLPSYEELRRIRKQKKTRAQIIRNAESSLENLARDARLRPALAYLKENGLDITYEKKRDIPGVIARL